MPDYSDKLSAILQGQKFQPKDEPFFIYQVAPIKSGGYRVDCLNAFEESDKYVGIVCETRTYGNTLATSAKILNKMATVYYDVDYDINLIEE